MMRGMADREGSSNDGFVRAIRHELDARRVSQRELALRIQKTGWPIAVSTVNQYLTRSLDKRSSMSLDFVSAAAAALGVDEGDLFALARTLRRASHTPLTSARDIGEALVRQPGDATHRPESDGSLSVNLPPLTSDQEAQLRAIYNEAHSVGDSEGEANHS